MINERLVDVSESVKNAELTIDGIGLIQALDWVNESVLNGCFNHSFASLLCLVSCLLGI